VKFEEWRGIMSNEGLFMEESIIGAVRGLLTGRVNEVLGEADCSVPPIEFSERQGGNYAIRPEIRLCEGKRTEKDRIVRLDVYSLAVSFSVPGIDGERNCYAYAAAVDAAVAEDTTLGGIVDRAVLESREYVRPKHANCGEDWEVVLNFRITSEV
jgi:hypothetical protein